MDEEKWAVIEEFARLVRDLGISNIYVDERGGGRVQLGEHGDGQKRSVFSFHIDSDEKFKNSKLSPPPPRHNGAW